jgi:hypothetical protein
MKDGNRYQLTARRRQICRLRSGRARAPLASTVDLDHWYALPLAPTDLPRVSFASFPPLIPASLHLSVVPNSVRRLHSSCVDLYRMLRGGGYPIVAFELAVTA